MDSKIKVVILPGVGRGDVSVRCWYKSVAEELRKRVGLTVKLENMPDPEGAHEAIWLDFMEKSLKCDQNTVVIGHSSGAEAAMRYAETRRLKGIVLVSAYVSDLGLDVDRESGYHNRPWEWEKTRSNTEFIIQFASDDDPLIEYEEQEEVAHNLKTELYAYDDKGHFITAEFPELVDVVSQRLNKLKAV